MRKQKGTNALIDGEKMPDEINGCTTPDPLPANGSTHSATPSNIIPAAPLVHDENRLPHLGLGRHACIV